MASNKVQIKFDIDNKDLEIASGSVLTLQKQIRILKQEIQKPGYSPAELDILKKKLADTEDAFKANKARSGDFLTSLQLIPGPIGDIASKLNGAISLIKQFGSFKISDLKFQLKETFDDIKDVGSAIANATGLTKAWTFATGLLSKMFVGLGASQKAAAVASRALAAAIAATGIGLLVVALSSAVSGLMDFVSNTKKAEQANKDFGDSLKMVGERLDAQIQRVKDEGEIRLLEAKKRKASEGELQKIKEDNIRRELKAIEKALSEKGEYFQKEMQLETDLNMSEEDRQAKREEIAEARNALGKRQYELRVELQKLELQGEIDANNRSEEAAKVAQGIKEQNLAKDKKRQEEYKKLTAERIQQIRDITANVVAGFAKEKEAQDAAIQSRKDFNKQIRDLYTSLITDERARKREELKNAQQDEMDDMMQNKEYIKADETEKGRIRYAIRQKYANLFKQLRTENAKEDRDKDEQESMDTLRLLELKGQALVQGTRAYYQNRNQIIDETLKVEQGKLDKDYADGLIKEEEYNEKSKILVANSVAAKKALRQQEIQSIGQTISASIDALASLGNALAGSLDEEAKTSKTAFEKRKKLQVATAVMSAASGLVQILTQPSTLPSPFDWITKGINAAALGIATATNIKKIQATQFEGGGTEQTGPINVVARRAQGGIVRGAGTSTSDSIPAMLSDGEYVVNARATGAFLPLLTAINDMGRTPRFAMGGLVQPQSPETMFTENLTRALQTNMERPVKTYVVGQDMSNQQQFDRTIKSRSLL